MTTATIAAPTVIIAAVAASAPTERPAKRAMMSETPQASAQPAPQAAALSSMGAASRCHAIMRRMPREWGPAAGCDGAVWSSVMAARSMGAETGPVEVRTVPRDGFVMAA